jgi:hypothetical protein
MHGDLSPDKLHQIAGDAIREALILGGGTATTDSARTDAAMPAQGSRNDSRRHAAADDMAQQWKRPKAATHSDTAPPAQSKRDAATTAMTEQWRKPTGNAGGR